MANNNGGQLRWWQEEEKKTQPAEPRWYANPPAPQEIVSVSLPSPQAQLQATPSLDIDIGEELEAEARRRAELERDAVVIEGNMSEIIRKKRHLMMWILFPTAIFEAFLAFTAHSPFLFALAILLIAEAIFLPLLMKKTWRNRSPRLSLSPLGLNLDMPFYRLGPIFWHEVKSVRVRKMLFMRYVQIDLKDQKAVLQRAFHSTGKPNQFTKLNAWLYRFFPIQLDDSFFPISAEAMAAQIALYEGKAQNSK